MSPPKPTFRQLVPVCMAGVFLLFFGLSSEADEALPPLTTIEILAEIPRPGSAQPVPAENLVVLENGVRRAVTDVEPVVQEWRIVLYFDRLLSASPTLRSAAEDLARSARSLVDMGTVEIVIGEEKLRTALPATRDAVAVDEALAWVALREAGEEGQVEVRKAATRRVEGLADVLRRRGEASPDLLDVELLPLESAVEEAVAVESELLSGHHERLIDFVAQTTSEAPTALVWVSSGFDDDSLPFYRSLVASSGVEAARFRFPTGGLATDHEDLVEALAGFGWVIFAYAPEGRSAELSSQESPGPRSPTEDDLDEMKADSERAGEPLFDIVQLVKRGREQSSDETVEKPWLTGPMATLERVVANTGGRTLLDYTDLSSAIAGFSDWVRIGFATDAGWGESRRVELREDSEDGEIYRSAGSFSRGTPGAVAGVRARRYLNGEVGEGEIPFTAAIRTAAEEGADASLTVQLEAVAEASADPGTLRVTVAAQLEDGSPPLILSRTMESAEVVPGDDRTPRFLQKIPLRFDDPTGRLVVLFEDLRAGSWGATYATRLESSGVALEGELESWLLPGPGVVHLLSPPRGMVAGDVRFETVVTDPAVSEVRFLVDGRQKEIAREAPFAVTIDLGPLPDMRKVEAVAYDASGAEIGRDRTVLNEGGGSFRVRILRPRLEDPDGGTASITGPVDVEAEVKIPRGRRIERVEFYWNDSIVATRFSPPFIQRILVRKEDSQGFVRVVARLEDGSLAEDVVFLNSPGSAARLQVNLVELYVVVTDRDSRPVRGLSAEDFRVREDRDEVELSTFSDAGDLPLTVGLAIDSSASMFFKLQQVEQAASSFLDGLSSQRDRAFLVGFGSEPELYRDTTANISRVQQALGYLDPEGQTAFWTAIVYSLVQLQGVPGKKALIVYSDGADEDPDFSFRTCLRFANKVGVPIYVILSNNELARTGGKSLKVGGFLDRIDRLTSEVGGRVFLTRVGEDLEAIYRQIDDEIRSQYLLGYYSSTENDDEWRDISVDVDRPGLSARTISGYFR